LAEQGVGIHVLLFYEGLLLKRLESRQIPITLVKGKYDPRTIFTVRRILIRLGADVVHVHGYRASVVAGMAARLAGVRLVRTEHGQPEPFTGAGWLKMKINTGLEGLVSSVSADAVVFVSADMKHKAGKGARGALNRVIYNGIDPSDVRPSSGALGRSTTGKPSFTLGIVGRLSPVKGHMTLFRALARLSHLPAIRLNVIGEGPEEQNLRDTCERLGLQKCVRFHGFRRDIATCMCQLDALVMPSWHEGLPYTPLEAMFLRVPVVASAVGGLCEVIENGRSGLLVPPGDVNGLATAIERLYAEPQLRVRLANEAYSRVQQRFLADGMTRAHLALYHKVSA
jgi:glycosyltransferase involved in cell wall biosynthesis